MAPERATVGRGGGACGRARSPGPRPAVRRAAGFSRELPGSRSVGRDSGGMATLYGGRGDDPGAGLRLARANPTPTPLPGRSGQCQRAEGGVESAEGPPLYRRGPCPSEPADEVADRPKRDCPARAHDPGPPRIQANLPRLLEVPHGRTRPLIAPPDQVEWDVGPGEWRRRHVCDPGAWLEVDRSPRSRDPQTEVDVLPGVQERFVERPQPCEEVGASEHTVELGEARALSRQREDNFGGSAPFVALKLVENPSRAFLVDRHLATGHVDDLACRRADKAEGADEPSLRFLRASHQRVEPARRDFYVVVDEDDVPSIDVAEPEVARFVWRQETVRLDKAEAQPPLLGGKVAAERARRTTVHVDERERPGGVGVNALEGAARGTEALARHDDDRHREPCHQPWSLPPCAIPGTRPAAGRRQRTADTVASRDRVTCAAARARNRGPRAAGANAARRTFRRAAAESRS